MAVGVPSQLHRISPQEYRRLVEAGVFDEDARIELIEGLIVDMSPKTRAHENAVAWLNERLVLAVDRERFEVRVAAPLSIGDSEPEPDVAVVDRAAPRPNHPATAVLVIEVAVSSTTRDLVEKPPVYASAGVVDYWVLDLDARRAVVHAEPVDGAYTLRRVLGQDDELRAAAPGVSLRVGDVLAASAR